MFGNGMCNFMPKHNGKARFVLGERENAFVNNYLTAWHTEGVNLVVGHQVKFPLEIL